MSDVRKCRGDARSEQFMEWGGAATPRRRLGQVRFGHLVHPLGGMFAANWAPYHLGDIRAFFHELLHGFRFDLVAWS